MVLGIGFFDGVHLGHMALLRRVRKISVEKNMKSGVLTFLGHPLSVIDKKPVELINTKDEREYLIRDLGIADVTFLTFDGDMRSLQYGAFTEKYLNASHIVAGYNFRFGYLGEGNSENLKEECGKRNIGCDIIDCVTKDGRPVSSTHIRSLIKDGRIQEANGFLGHNHMMMGKVVKGGSRGGTLGAPTVNMNFEENIMIPRYGVYKSRIFFDGCGYQSVTNIGVRPTVSETGRPVAETHILDFDGDLYGKNVRVEFLRLLREERKFNGLDDLRGQIKKDIEMVRDDKT